MSSGLYSHTTRGVGTVLTAAIYNADHVNHVTNHNPSQMGGYSDSVSEMQTASNPGGLGTEVLATSLAEELRHLRFVIARITGQTHWYQAPVTDLATIGGGVPLNLAFAATPITLRRTENNTSEIEFTSVQAGSGVGNKYSKRLVGTGSNAVAEVREYIGSIEMLRRSSTLITHFLATYFSSYTDIVEIAAPANPAANIARLYAKDVGGLTRLCYRDAAGTEHILTTPPEVSWPASASTEYSGTTTFNTNIPLDSSVPTNSEGTQILNVDITPTRSNSKIRVKISMNVIASSATNFIVAVFRGSTCIGARTSYNQASHNHVSFELEDEPGAGTHTYSVRVGTNGFTFTLHEVFGTAGRPKLFLQEEFVN